MNLLSPDDFRTAARAKRAAGDGVFRVSVAEPKALEDGSRKVRFCFSDGSIDRMGDRIDPVGWNVNAFMKNPVALFAHDSSAPPIGRASNVLVEDQRLMGDVEFMPPETYAFADTIYRMVLGKYLNAVSVGFLPTDYSWSDEDGRDWGIDYKQQELLEISIVPVPANANALIEARSKGIDTRPLVEWAERTLDGGGKIVLPKAELQRLRKAAKEPAMTKPRGAGKPARRDTEPMAETDPSDGGATIGNCGRPISEECGMKDVAECSIHGFGGTGVGEDPDADKNLAALIRREVAAAVKAAFKGAPKAVRREPDPDPDPDGGADPDRPDVSPDHEKCIRMAHMHMKAMGDAMEVAGDHYDKAMDALSDVKDALDASPPSDDGEGGGDDPEGEKAARLRRARDLRRSLGV